MGNTSLKKIQQAIYNNLTGHAPLMAIINGVFDSVPTTTAAPFITTGDVTENNFNTFERSGRDVLYTLHIWSEHEGFSQCYDILSIVNGLLDYQIISISNYTLVYGRFETANTIRDPDGVTFHLVAQYRFVVQEV